MAGLPTPRHGRQPHGKGPRALVAGCCTARQLVWVAGDVVNLCCNDNSCCYNWGVVIRKE